MTDIIRKIVSKISFLDPPLFPVREQGPETGLYACPKYLSKTDTHKKPTRSPSDANP